MDQSSALFECVFFFFQWASLLKNHFLLILIAPIVSLFISFSFGFLSTSFSNDCFGVFKKRSTHDRPLMIRVMDVPAEYNQKHGGALANSDYRKLERQGRWETKANVVVLYPSGACVVTSRSLLQCSHCTVLVLLLPLFLLHCLPVRITPSGSTRRVPAGDDAYAKHATTRTPGEAVRRRDQPGKQMLTRKVVEKKTENVFRTRSFMIHIRYVHTGCSSWVVPLETPLKQRPL